MPALRDVAALRFADRATDIVLLGTGGSSLGGQTLAQLAGHAVPGVGALRDGARLHFVDNLDPRVFCHVAGTAAAADLALHRDFEIRRHRRNLDAEHRGACRRCRPQVCGPRIPRYFPRAQRACQGRQSAMACAICSALESVALLDHHTGVGGRFSVLTNVGLLPAAMLGLDVVALREGAAAALAPVLAKKAGREVPAALGAALSVALR